MRIFTGKKWRNGFLDYCRNKNEYRIQVFAWKNLEKLENVYHTRAKSLRLLINYFPVVGFHGLFTKIWSRVREDRRNEKYVSCGFGRIIESANDQIFSKGELVGFVAPLHPALVERIVLPEKLIFKINKLDISETPADKILYFPLGENKPQNIWWKDIKGWSVYSGIKISEETQNMLADGLKKEIRDNKWSESQQIISRKASSIAETKEQSTLPAQARKTNSKAKSGVLFGYGNYAKINIIPYTRPFVDIKSVHEIDPTQKF